LQLIPVDSGAPFLYNENMKTSSGYLSDMSRMQRRCYILGERVSDFSRHPLIVPSLSALGRTYEAACEPQFAPMFARSGLDGEPVNLFTSLHRSSVNRSKRSRRCASLGCQTGTCF
jgi:aromatic ring hydroxylase